MTNTYEMTRCALFLVDRVNKKLVSQIADGIGTNQITIGLNEGIAGHVVQTGKNINITDAYSNEFFNPEVDKSTGIVLLLFFPLPYFLVRIQNPNDIVHACEI